MPETYLRGKQAAVLSPLQLVIAVFESHLGRRAATYRLLTRLVYSRIVRMSDHGSSAQCRITQ